MCSEDEFRADALGAGEGDGAGDSVGEGEGEGVGVCRGDSPGDSPGDSLGDSLTPCPQIILTRSTSGEDGMPSRRRSAPASCAELRIGSPSRIIGTKTMRVRSSYSTRPRAARPWRAVRTRRVERAMSSAMPDALKIPRPVKSSPGFVVR